MQTGEFGFVPSLPITPIKFTIDGKPVLELTAKDMAIAEGIFNFVMIIKFGVFVCHWRRSLRMFPSDGGLWVGLS